MKQQLSCGAAWGHLGGFPGYTAVALSSGSGARQVVALVNASQDALTPAAQKQLWRTIQLGYCG